MKKIYCLKKDLHKVLEEENRKQGLNKVFYNITIRPYKGNKYSKDYIVITI